MRRPDFRGLVPACLAALAALHAPAASAYVSGGHEYELSCNASGYVLTSKHPVSRPVGHGAGTQYVSGIEKIYLGRSCDAFVETLGTGTWCWGNGGFRADFEFTGLGFPRQQPDCPDGADEAYGRSCRC